MDSAGKVLSIHTAKIPAVAAGARREPMSPLRSLDFWEKLRRPRVSKSPMPSWAFLRAFLARRDVIPGRTLPSGSRATLALLLPDDIHVRDAGLLEQVPPHRQGLDRMFLEEVVRELRE